MNQVIILAAGKGTRMGSDLPKVLIPIKGKPIIQYLIESVLISGSSPKPIIVVSPDNQKIIRDALKEYDLDYVVQEEQLGTGHAVSCAKKLLQNSEIEKTLILYGDHPFIKPTTIQRIVGIHNYPVTMVTTQVDNFEGWYQNFIHWGRIIRVNDQIKEIIEFRDASPEQQAIKEINPALFCFDNTWLWKNIELLETNNQQREYYLTDLIKIATSQEIEINSLKIDPEEAIGINNLEELTIAEKLLNKPGALN
ncbi:MAG: NTP transferase domain-containing protein [Patescibacteria group bacterium]|jgi:bifunctional UDP-N-acetylglucosamine pyrophosphorylase/glucosamine-1-phosphate N-acetyltransferase